MNIRLLFTAVILSFVSKAEIKINQLDTINVGTKFNIFKDLFYRSAELTNQLRLNDSTTVDTENGKWIEYLADSLSNRSCVDFFPDIIEIYITKVSDKESIQTSFESGDFKTFRKELVENLTKDYADALNSRLLNSVVESTNAKQKPEMASFMFKEGKIYVVVGVLCLIFAGIVIFLFTLQKKINSLSK